MRPWTPSAFKVDPEKEWKSPMTWRVDRCLNRVQGRNQKSVPVRAENDALRSISSPTLRGAQCIDHLFSYPQDVSLSVSGSMSRVRVQTLNEG